MSIVVQHEIIESIKNGDLKFSPALDDLQFRPHAVDLRLGFTFRIPKQTLFIGKKSKGRSAAALDYLSVNNGHFSYYDEVKLRPGQYFDLLPGEWVMGFTLESIHIKSNMLMGVLYPRSSVNRRGLAVDMTGIVDTGYKGRLMIPIHNTTSMQVIRLYPGERICQLVLERLEQPVRSGYEGRYSYNRKTGTASSYRPELHNRETELIRSGKIKEIKKEFRLKT